MNKTKFVVIMLVSCFLLSFSESNAASRNVEIAAGRLIERYPETHILPSVGLGIFIGESGGGYNNGRYYGNMSSRIYDIEDSTDQFLDLMKRYGNVDDQETWIGQLYALQSHGYYGGSSGYYIGYITSIIERNDFDEYDKKAKRYEKRQKKKKREQRRKAIQRRRFILAYDPTLSPWQVRTHRGAIKGGTIRIESNVFSEYAWLDVVDTEDGEDQVIHIGSLQEVMTHPIVELADVIEEAVG